MRREVARRPMPPASSGTGRASAVVATARGRMGDTNRRRDAVQAIPSPPLGHRSKR